MENTNNSVLDNTSNNSNVNNTPKDITMNENINSDPNSIAAPVAAPDPVEDDFCLFQACGPDLAPEGFCRGKFVDMKLSNDKTEIILFVELENKDSNNKPYVVAKEYNMKGRGPGLLKASLDSWNGKEFDDKVLRGMTKSFLVNKKVVVEIKHSGKGKQKSMGISAFHPADTHIPNN